VKLGVAGLGLVLFSRNEAVTARGGSNQKPKQLSSLRPAAGTAGPRFFKIFFYSRLCSFVEIRYLLPWYENTSSAA
jgi:hypothetical protein